MNTEILIGVDKLKRELDDWVILDCRHNLFKPGWGQEQYKEGHIPGARFVNLDENLSAPKAAGTGRHPLPSIDQLVTFFRSIGVNNDSQVVVYDDMGGAFAARAWWILRWLGLETVAMLDGGIPAWLKAGGELAKDLPKSAIGHFSPSTPLGWIVDAELILNNLNSPFYVIIDARAADRFRGENETIDPVAGHIPGAINRPFSMNLDSQGYFKPKENLKAEFLALIPSSTGHTIIHQCGSGVTACHNWFAMEYAGLRDSLKLYPGSWSEWVTDTNRPVEKG